MTYTIKFTNIDYFKSLEEAIRNEMKIAETKLLPIAKQAIKDAELTIKECPIEGYYWETPELTNFFKCIKTLQDPDNFKTIITPSIQLLHDFYSSEALGVEQAYLTAISNKARYGDRDPVIISGRVDQLTIATQVFTTDLVMTTLKEIKELLTIDNICKELYQQPTGKNLVGLGLLVDRIENKKDIKLLKCVCGEKREYNPLTTTYAAETTTLSRALPPTPGGAPPPSSEPTPLFLVDKEVEKLAHKITDSYNEMFENAKINNRLEWRYSKFWNAELPVIKRFGKPIEYTRCARLYTHDEPIEHYHWATSEYSPIVKEFWDENVITTKDLLDGYKIKN